MKVEISLFKFDSKSDYLPYYTKHFLKTENEKNLLDILNTINKDQDFGYENYEEFDLVVNGVYVKANISIKDLKENFGNELTIEPISIRRAYKDLLVDIKDYEQKISLLSDFINKDELKEYKNLKQYYYASNTLNYFNDYIGDAVLFLANELIQKNPKQKEAILKILKEEKVSASYYTSLKNRIFNFDLAVEESIFNIQKALKIREELDKQNFRINTTLKLDFGEYEENIEIKHDFKDFNYAYYSTNTNEQYENLLCQLKGNRLTCESLKLDLAKNTFNNNPEITYWVSSTILLDVFDNNADFLLVDNLEDFYIFDYNRKELEKRVGRDVLLPIIHINELQKLVAGQHKEARITLEKHQVNPEII